MFSFVCSSCFALRWIVVAAAVAAVRSTLAAFAPAAPAVLNSSSLLLRIRAAAGLDCSLLLHAVCCHSSSLPSLLLCALSPLSDNWAEKAKRRRTEGTGRMQYVDMRREN
jgi:hypothetical protein